MTATDTPLASMPFSRHHPLELSPEYAQLRRHGPVVRVATPVGDPAWLVLGHPQTRALLGDDRLGRAHPEPDRAARYSASFLQGGPMGDAANEREEFARMRRAVAPAFTPRRVASIGTSVVGMIDRVLDDLAAAGPGADFRELVSFPLPLMVMCSILGVPIDDGGRFRAWSDTATALYDGDRIGEGFLALVEHTRWLLDQKRAEPGDDLVSDLLYGEGHEELSEHYLAAVVAGLLFAGHDTAQLRLAHGVLMVLEAPLDRDALCHDDQLVSGVVEEVFRLAMPARPPLLRYAREPLSVDGADIRAGDLVLLPTQAANQDPAVFPDPERFDPARRPNQQASFGHGHRFCPGAALARIEFSGLFSAMFARFPRLRLAVPIEDMLAREDPETGGLTDLPVTW